MFYKTTSSEDKGSMCNLRNYIGRIDVQGPDDVIQKYRYTFVCKKMSVYLIYIQCTFVCTCTTLFPPEKICEDA